MLSQKGRKKQADLVDCPGRIIRRGAQKISTEVKAYVSIIEFMVVNVITLYIPVDGKPISPPRQNRQSP